MKEFCTLVKRQQQESGFNGQFDWRKISDQISQIIQGFDSHKCCSLWYFLSFGIIPDETLSVESSNKIMNDSGLNLSLVCLPPYVKLMSMHSNSRAFF